MMFSGVVLFNVSETGTALLYLFLVVLPEKANKVSETYGAGANPEGFREFESKPV